MNTRVVLDTDFGRGERFEAACVAGGGLHYIGVAPRVPPAPATFEGSWPLDVPGFHRVIVDDGVTLDLLVGPLEAVLPQVRARVDTFHLSGDVPPALARQLAKLAAPGAGLLARAPDEALVWALTAAGFVCRLAEPSAAPATAPDIAAVYRGRLHAGAQAPEPVRCAVVIGAGVAGSSLAHRLCAHGWQVTLIERHAQPAREASGNLAGIFMPLLSRDDNIPTRLSRAAYLFALREWRRFGGIGRAFDGADCGVLQLARDARHAQVQQDVLAAWDYPRQYARWADAREASALIGAETPHGGWLFEQGGWARPASLCEAMLDACGDRLRRVFRTEALDLRRVGEEWQVCGADGALVAQAPTVILSSGASAGQIAQAAELPLFKLRGQVTHLPVDDSAPLDEVARAAASVIPAQAGIHTSPETRAQHGFPLSRERRVPVLPLVVCREAYVTPPSHGVVCAGATYDNDDDPKLRADSQLENLTRLAEIIPSADVAALAHTAPLAGRVGFRCAAPDRLPLAGALPDYPNAGRLEFLADVPRHPGLHCLLGYASRGLIWAPLMAELLVSQLEQRPPPLEAALVDALDPGRFLLKQRRREQ